MPISMDSLYEDSDIAFLSLEWRAAPGKRSDFVICYANEAAAVLLDLPKAQVFGHSLIAFFSQSRSKWLELAYMVACQNYPHTYAGRTVNGNKKLYLDFSYQQDGSYHCFLSNKPEHAAMSLLGKTELHEKKPLERLKRDFMQLLTEQLQPMEPAVELVEPGEVAKLVHHCGLLLADTSLSVSQTLQGLLEQLALHFGAQDAFGLLLAEGRTQALWPEKKKQILPPALLEKPLEESLALWEQVKMAPSYLLVTEAEGMPEVFRGFGQRIGLGSALQIPIMRAGKCLGLLGFQNVTRGWEALWMLRPIFDNLACMVECLQLLEKNHRLETTDMLTGHLNFTGFSARAQKLIKEHPARNYAMLYCDIRRFKYINEDYGHEVGDKLLHYWAHCLERLCRNGDIFCRVAADHVIILRWYYEKQELAGFFQTMRSGVNGFPLFTDQPTTVEMVCGAYLLTEADMKAPDISKIMDRAGITQKAAKEGSGTRFAYYSNDLRERQMWEVEVVQGLESAIETGEIYLAFQPQYNYVNGHIIGAEALVRWRHRSLGDISPADFVPVLERNNLIHILDQYVWDETCRYIRSLLNAGFTDQMVPISVNISRLDINMLELTTLLPAMLEKYSLAPHCLTLEITESAYIDTPARLIDTVSGLRELGFSVEMDDFGSGYSSLNSLKDVPVDVLKLDMRFLEDNEQSARGGSILSSIIRMANWMNLPVIAEGVETVDQADYLKAVGCSIMQGYLFSQPVTGNVLANLLWENDQVDFAAKRGQTFQLDISEFLRTKGENSYLFHHCIGGACILEYSPSGQRVEALLYNQKFPTELGISFEQAEKLRTSLQNLFPELARMQIFASLHCALEEKSHALEIALPQADGSRRLLRFQHHYLESREQRHMFFCLVEDLSKKFAVQEDLEQISIFQNSRC